MYLSFRVYETITRLVLIKSVTHFSSKVVVFELYQSKVLVPRKI